MRNQSMSRDQDDDVQAVARLWEERFGEPPPILDRDLMWAIMADPHGGSAKPARPGRAG